MNNDIANYLDIDNKKKDYHKYIENIKLNKYDKEMLYCLNTSDHAIWVKEIQFSDFIGFGLDYSVPGVHKFWESIKDRHTESIN